MLTSAGARRGGCKNYSCNFKKIVLHSTYLIFRFIYSITFYLVLRPQANRRIFQESRESFVLHRQKKKIIMEETI